MSDEMTFCVHCGPNVKIDDDGTCSSCGSDAYGKGIEYIESLRAEVERLESTCPLCGHEWRQHDPEDGRCDAGPPCDCGRDLTFMTNRIKELSCRALDGEE